MSREDPLTCEQALRFLAAYLDGELHLGLHEDVEHHLEICRSCFSRAEFERRLKAEVGGLGREEVSSDFEARVRRLLNSFTASARNPADRS